MFAGAGSPSTGPLLVGCFSWSLWRGSIAAGEVSRACLPGPAQGEGDGTWATLPRLAQALLPCWRGHPTVRDRAEGKGQAGMWGGIWRGRCWPAWPSPCVCSASLRSPVCSCTEVGSPCSSRSASCSQNTGCDGIKCLGERRNKQLLQTVFQRPLFWCGAQAFQSSSHSGKG